MPHPALRVIIPAFNMARWQPYAVESCPWQSRGDIEVVTKCPARFYYFRQEHKGINSSLETEIEHSLRHFHTYATC